MNKKKILSEGSHEIVYPFENDVLGIVKKMLGYDRALVKCQDGKTRLCRIRGKMKKRKWIKEGDMVLVSPWEFQSDERGEIFLRYTSSQVDELQRKGMSDMVRG